MFSLSGNRTFRPTLRASYIHSEISDISTGLLYPHRNFGYLHGSLTPSQKFGISPQVYYTHTEIRGISLGLLYPHRNFGFLHGSLTPTQKFEIAPRVSYTHTKISGYLPGSLTPTQDLSDTTAGLLHPNSRLFHLRGLTTPFFLCPTHINYSSFPSLNYESSLYVVPKTNPTHTHEEWLMTIPCTHTRLYAMSLCT